VSEIIVMILVISAIVSMTIAFLRMVRGPTQADRVVALDIVFSCNVALTAAAAVAEDAPLFLDVGLGLGLVGFLGTVLWARLLEKSPRALSRSSETGGAHE
jgi:multicomponent Na+:H+ antiporter subunit F